MIFDNAKVKALVPDFDPVIPFAEGARQIVEWYDAHPDQQTVDPAVNAVIDTLVGIHRDAASRRPSPAT